MEVLIMEVPLWLEYLCSLDMYLDHSVDNQFVNN